MLKINQILRQVSIGRYKNFHLGSKSNVEQRLGVNLKMQIHEKAGIISLNRPTQLNALNLKMKRDLRMELENYLYRYNSPEYAWQKHLSPKCDFILLNSTVQQAFCAGGDVIELYDQITAGFDNPEKGEKGWREALESVWLEYQLCHDIANLPIPAVAVISGIVMGGGAGISMNCPYKIATEKTVFAMPETKIGFFPDAGASYFLNRLRVKDDDESKQYYPNLAMWMALCAVQIRAYDTFLTGIATHYVHSKYINEMQADLVYLNNENDNIAEDIESVLNHYHNLTLEEIDEDENRDLSFIDNMPVIDEVFSKDSVSEMKLALQNISSSSENENSTDYTESQRDFAEGTLQLLENKSPTSLELTQIIMNAGKEPDFTLDDALKIDWSIAINCMQEFDMIEGIRSLLIEKNYQPKWMPLDENLERYFMEQGGFLPGDKRRYINLANGGNVDYEPIF